MMALVLVFRNVHSVVCPKRVMKLWLKEKQRPSLELFIQNPCMMYQSSGHFLSEYCPTHVGYLLNILCKVLVSNEYFKTSNSISIRAMHFLVK